MRHPPPGTENGAFDPRGLSISERAVGIAHLASPAARENLLRRIFDSPEFHHAKGALSDGAPRGVYPYDTVNRIS